MFAGQSMRPIEIMLVEDSPGDARLAIEALKDGKIENRLSIAVNGVEALARLRQEPPYAAEPRPDLILLDLNLPRKDGREVLAELKADPRLQSIPVVILTGSRAENDVLQAYELEVAAYVTKPVDFDQLISVVDQIDAFRLSIVTLESEGRVHSPSPRLNLR
jgi:two-component system, chemotaxis family, response regulator Rcp1